MIFFIFLFCVHPTISLGSSRLSVCPDSGPAGKGLVWELFISKYLDVRRLLGMRKGMCQSSIGSFEILVPVANVLPSFNIKHLS